MQSWWGFAQDEASGKAEKVKKIKCRYFNKGFCKYRKKCRYLHPKNICSDYVTNAKCLQTTCEDRHPEMCKFWGGTSKCKRNESCDFLHATFENSDNGEVEYRCIGCTNSWNDKNCVFEHIINGRQTFFCLNCEVWVKFKTRVYEADWTIYDESGYLKGDVWGKERNGKLNERW